MAQTTTFLQLCKNTRQEAGIQGQGPVSVLGRSGIEKKIVDWVAASWTDIQRMHKDWLLMATGFSFETSVGIDRYSIATTTGLTGMSSIDPTLMTAYLTSAGKADEYQLQYQPDYASWRRSYDIGVATNGKAAGICFSPSDELIVYPPPDGAYTIRGEGRKSPQVLAANETVIAIDDEYVNAILWKAVRQLAGDQESPALYVHADSNYDEIVRRMEMELLPTFKNYTSPLA